MTPTTLADVVEAAHALGVRDIELRAGGIVTMRTVLADMQRRRFDAVHAAVALDGLFPRPSCTWRPVCCWCVDSLECASAAELEAHRVNKDTGHDTGCCSFCGAGGRDTLVAAIPDAMFDPSPVADVGALQALLTSLVAARRAGQP